MSRHFTQGKLQGQERREVLQEVQQQVKLAALAAIKPVFTAFLQAEQQAKLGREKDSLCQAFLGAIWSEEKINASEEKGNAFDLA